MRPHPRTRRSAMWSSLGVGVVFALLFAASDRWRCSGIWYEQGRVRDITIAAGTFHLQFDEGSAPRGLGYPASRWRWEARSYTFIDWWPPPFRHFAYRSGATKVTIIEIPLWLPTLITLGLAAILSRVDARATRREKQGKCTSCGYDLAGLASGAACPECGKGAAS